MSDENRYGPQDSRSWDKDSANTEDSRNDMGWIKETREHAANAVPFDSDWPPTLLQTVKRQFLHDVTGDAFQAGWDAAVEFLKDTSHGKD